MTTEDLLTASEAITRATTKRKEGHRSHFRDDYSEVKTFDEVKIIVRRRCDGEMNVLRERIPEMRTSLKQVIEKQR